MNPILKWPGGKRWLAPTLKQMLPSDYTHIVEPFAGGAALFFALESRGGYSLHDTNPHLMNFYSMLATFPSALIKTFSQIRDNVAEEDYYKVRSALNAGQSGRLWDAAYWLYLNKTSYNGLVRFNRKGEFNAPYGKYPKPGFPSDDELMKASWFLSGAILNMAGYEHTMGGTYGLKKVLFYVDPPYYGQFNGYSTSPFTHEDHQGLATLIKRLTKCGAYVILSNSYTLETVEMFGFMNISTVSRHQGISCTNETRGRTVEMLATNF